MTSEAEGEEVWFLASTFFKNKNVVNVSEAVSYGYLEI